MDTRQKAPAPADDPVKVTGPNDHPVSFTPQAKGGLGDRPLQGARTREGQKRDIRRREGGTGNECRDPE
jgi:hypothetical protein